MIVFSQFFFIVTQGVSDEKKLRGNKVGDVCSLASQLW